MDNSEFLVLTIVIAVEIALISLAFGTVFWWLYRKALAETKGLKSEKLHLESRRDTHLRFLNERLHNLDMRRDKKQGAESRLEHLERRILEEDKLHTEAAQLRDTEIWDLRTGSTKALVEAVRAIDPKAHLTRLSEASEGSANDALGLQPGDQDQQVERQRREIQELSPYRDAWIRLYRYAQAESEENARLRAALRQIRADEAAAQAIKSALESNATHRAVLDDYLNTTAATYEEASPPQAKRARRHQQQIKRLHSVVDTASSRVDDVTQQFPAVLEEQKKAITSLEAKLEQAREGQQLLKQNYTRELQRLKTNHRDAVHNASSLEKENRRLNYRVRNLLELTRDKHPALIPTPTDHQTGMSKEDTARKDAEIGRLHQALRGQLAKTKQLESQLAKYQVLETASHSTLQPGEPSS